MPAFYRYAQTPTPTSALDYRAELIATIDDLPPPPIVLNRVLALLNDSKTSSGQIAIMIEKDAVLSCSVLRCVNSAYSGLPATVTSARHAVAMMAFATVRNLALAFSMRRMLTRS